MGWDRRIDPNNVDPEDAVLDKSYPFWYADDFAYHGEDRSDENRRQIRVMRKRPDGGAPHSLFAESKHLWWEFLATQKDMSVTGYRSVDFTFFQSFRVSEYGVRAEKEVQDWVDSLGGSVSHDHLGSWRVDLTGVLVLEVRSQAPRDVYLRLFVEPNFTYCCEGDCENPYDTGAHKASFDDIDYLYNRLKRMLAEQMLEPLGLTVAESRVCHGHVW